MAFVKEIEAFNAVELKHVEMKAAMSVEEFVNTEPDPFVVLLRSIEDGDLEAVKRYPGDLKANNGVWTALCRALQFDREDVSSTSCGQWC